MSWKLTGLVSQKRVGSTTRKLVLLSMADKANDDGGGVYASFATLAEMCEASRATVKRVVKEFLSEGLVRHVGMRGFTNGAQTNEYDLNVEAIGALDAIATQPRSKADPVHHDPGSPRTRSKVNPDPVHGDPPTRFTMTPKPILKPIQEPFFKGVQENGPPPDTEPKQKKARKRSLYTTEFEAFWASWPKTWRERSDKQLAFKRWTVGTESWPVETIMLATKKHVERSRKDAYRYCGRADVFLNGKLEAAVEAVTGAVAGATSRIWDADLKTWVERAL